MITGTKIRLRSKSLADAPLDYAWQVDPELAWLDATDPLNCAFSDYIADYASDLRYPDLKRQRFAIETLDGKHIGNCVYYNVENTKRAAELGVTIGNRDYWGKGYGTDAVTALVNYVFRHTRLNRLYLRTLESNLRAQVSFGKCGFVPYGHMERDGYCFILMEMYRKEWEERQTQRGQPAVAEHT
ncbi:MAG: GNAT family N-acetyltransferase [Chloroflexi bacterium]|nr:GNAT family N-acetyltransferase [Chloroflexota bacterium]